MAEKPTRALLEGEVLIWEGRPTWRSFAGLTILGVVLAPVAVGLLILAWLGVKKRSVSWMVTSKRLEIESGFASRKIDTVELWKIRDVEWRQGLGDRIFGVATIAVLAHDEAVANVALAGIPADRAVYEKLATAVMSARGQRGVFTVAG